MNLPDSAIELAAAVREQRIRAAEVCEITLDRIAAVNPRCNAFLEVTSDHARARATHLDDVIARGETVGPLAGVPIALKDNICTRFGHTTCASNMLREYRSPYDATVVRRLEAAGAILIAKTNLDEFAMGSSTEHSAAGATRNPWDVTRVAGGSSGGSAVSVATRVTPLALGSDTGGSVRLPAAYCGVVGLKPTYGRVSRYGLVAYGSSLDQIGPFATRVADAALLLQVIAGRDELDATSAEQPVESYVAWVADGPVAEFVRGLRIGVPREYFSEGLDAEIRDAIEAALRVFGKGGAKCVELSLPFTSSCVAAYYLIATAEASSNLARFDGVHFGHRTAFPQDITHLYSASRDEGFGAEVKRRIMLGTYALSAGYTEAYYQKALRVRRLIRDALVRAFEQVDVLVSPVSPTPAFRIGEKCNDPLQMYLADIHTTGANLAGLPAISIPCGFTRGGLPIGMQLLAPAFAERRLLMAARFFEGRTDWHARIPPIK